MTTGNQPTEDATQEAPGVVLPSWAYPHTDAECYVEDVIKQTQEGLEQRTGQDIEKELEEIAWDIRIEEHDRQIDAEERKMRRKLAERFGPEPEDGEAGYDVYREREEHETDEYEGIKREYIDAPEEIREDPAEIKDRITTARQALARGDAEDVLSALSPLVDIACVEIDEDSLLNWSLLLVDWSSQDTAPTRAPLDTRERVQIAVHDLCDKLCRIIASDSRALRHIEWREMERVVAHALGGLGFEVTLTRPSKDGGKDVIATCVLHGCQLTYYIEIKHWRSGKMVGAKEVFHFLGVNAAEHTTGALLISTSGFDVKGMSRLVELSRARIRLGREMKVVTLCQHFVRQGRGLWTSPKTLPEILFEGTVASQ